MRCLISRGICGGCRASTVGGVASFAASCKISMHFVIVCSISWGGFQADVEIYSVLNSFLVRVPISFPVV